MKKIQTKDSNFVQVGATISKGLKEELRREAKEKRMLYSSYIETILVNREIKVKD